MATVKEVVIPSEKKKDGTWNVKVRITHEREVYFIKTQHFVNAKQIRKDFTIKDDIVLKMLHPVIDDYRTKISELGPKLGLYSAKQLAFYLQDKHTIKAEEINVITFGRGRIEELKEAKRDASAANMQTVVNSLVDFFKNEVVPVTEIRAKVLKKYETYLRGPREMTRLDQFKKEVKRKVKGLSDTGLHNHMRDLRILFNTIRDFYNDEDANEIVVKHNPFKKYKIVDPTPNEKPKLTIEQVVMIRDCEVKPGSRMEQARDLFMLSFYLCGMNAVDLHRLPPGQAAKERVDYKRSKTSSRRKDKAFISVHVPEIGRALYDKYAGTLQDKYATHSNLDHALAFGMKKIGEVVGIPDLEFYDARHAFGDLARNKCRFSKDDVGLALNHKDQAHAVTDIYVGKNWDIIDEVQTAVIKLLTDHDEKKKQESLATAIELPADLLVQPVLEEAVA